MLLLDVELTSSIMANIIRKCYYMHCVCTTHTLYTCNFINHLALSNYDILHIITCTVL